MKFLSFNKKLNKLIFDQIFTIKFVSRVFLLVYQFDQVTNLGIQV